MIARRTFVQGASMAAVAAATGGLSGRPAMADAVPNSSGTEPAKVEGAVGSRRFACEIPAPRVAEHASKRLDELGVVSRVDIRVGRLVRRDLREHGEELGIVREPRRIFGFIT